VFPNERFFQIQLIKRANDVFCGLIGLSLAIANHRGLVLLPNNQNLARLLITTMFTWIKDVKKD